MRTPDAWLLLFCGAVALGGGNFLSTNLAQVPSDTSLQRRHSLAPTTHQMPTLPWRSASSDFLPTNLAQVL